MKIVIFAFAFTLFSAVTVAQQCESLIALSKVSSATVADKSAVEQNASNFCSEYSKSGGKSGSSSFGASYKFLSLSSANADTSVEAIASKYCSASSNFSQSTDAYKQYVDTIAPGAFEAYQECIQLASKDVRFHLSANGILSNEFSMIVSFAGSTGNNRSAVISANPASGITCTWDGSSNKPEIELGTGQTTVLHCERKDADKRGYVIVARTDGTKESITIPWREYGKDGMPVDSLAALQARVRKLETELANLVAKHAITQTNLNNLTDRTAVVEAATAVVLSRSNACPSGWRRVATLLVGFNPESLNDALSSGFITATALVGGWPGGHPLICVRN